LATKAAINRDFSFAESKSPGVGCRFAGYGIAN
jgi:hypothetical protein